MGAHAAAQTDIDKTDYPIMDKQLNDLLKKFGVDYEFRAEY